MKPMKKNAPETILTVEGLTKTFVTGEEAGGKREVLRGVSLSVVKGEIVAIVGASGAGKSTLLHIMGTLYRPTSGRVIFAEGDVFSLSDEELARFRNRHIGFVFQFHHLLAEFTVLENVAMPALIRGERLSTVTGRAMELIHQVGLDGNVHQKPPQLSGGEQQRAAVARALMNSPTVVLADEPSGNLDTANAHALHDLIWNLSRSHGQTFVLVTHNENLAGQADRVVRLMDGLIQAPMGVNSPKNSP